MIDELLLLSGNDLPFLQGKLIIHQPRVKEIAFITEQRFWSACELLKFDKSILLDQDKNELSNRSNFNIIMTMIQERNIESQKAHLNVLSLLALMFPTYKINLKKNIIQFRNNETNEVGEINQDNFQDFKKILISMFCLTSKENKEYNPSGDLAKRIADKIRKGREKKAELAPSKKIAIISRYVSILAAGQQKDINDLMNYTIYQLMDEFRRFELKLHYDVWQRFKIAGAKDMKDPEDWLKDIHDENN